MAVISQGQGGRPTTRQLSVRSLVRDISRFLEPRADRKGLELVFYVEPSVPQSLPCESARLKQILYHVLDSAVRTTSTGVISCVVRHSEDNVTFIVTDSSDKETHLSAQRVARAVSLCRQLGGECEFYRDGGKGAQVSVSIPCHN